MNMILNISLSCLFFAAFGAAAHRLMGTSGNLLHLILIGACGYQIHGWIYKLFDIESGNLLLICGLILLGTCIAEWLSWKVQAWIYGRFLKYKGERDTYEHYSGKA